MDQVVGDSLIVDKKDQLGYFLSCAEWQLDALVEQFPTNATSSVVCVSFDGSGRSTGRTYQEAISNFIYRASLKIPG